MSSDLSGLECAACIYWGSALVSLLALLAVSVSAAWLSRETRVEEYKHDLVNVGHVGLSIVKECAALAQSGALSEADARKKALGRLRDVRYGEDGYFLVLDSKPSMVMHAMKPALNGKDLAGVADAHGRHHYVTFATAMVRAGWLRVGRRSDRIG